MTRLPITLLVSVLAACATAPGPEQAEEAVVPFTYSNGRPAVSVTLANGAEVPMVFDTGAQGLTLPETSVRSQNMPARGTTELRSPHGGPSQSLELVDPGVVRFGGVALSASEAGVAPQGGQGLPDDGRGVFGPLMFPNSIVEVDFAANTVRIGKSPLIAPARWYPLDTNGFLSGTMRVGDRNVPFTLDAGNPMGAVIPLSLVRELAPAANLQTVGRMQTVGTGYTLLLGRVDLPVELAGMTSRIGIVAAIDGGPDYINLGSRALEGLTIVIDNPNRRWGLLGTLVAEINTPGPQRRAAPGQ